MKAWQAPASSTHLGEPRASPRLARLAKQAVEGLLGRRTPGSGPKPKLRSTHPVTPGPPRRVRRSDKAPNQGLRSAEGACRRGSGTSRQLIFASQRTASSSHPYTPHQWIQLQCCQVQRGSRPPCCAPAGWRPPHTCSQLGDVTMLLHSREPNSVAYGRACQLRRSRLSQRNSQGTPTAWSARANATARSAAGTAQGVSLAQEYRSRRGTGSCWAKLLPDQAAIALLRSCSSTNLLRIQPQLRRPETAMVCSSSSASPAHQSGLEGPVVGRGEHCVFATGAGIRGVRQVARTETGYHRDPSQSRLSSLGAWKKKLAGVWGLHWATMSQQNLIQLAASRLNAGQDGSRAASRYDFIKASCGP